MHVPKYFRIGVYGLILQNNQILIAQEKIQETLVTKFPGGGLQFGEGTKNALLREFKEELDIEIEVIQHIYTTDFFVQSAFHKDYQVVAIYYHIKTNTLLPSQKFKKNNIEFLWLPIHSLDKNILTFDTDKKATEQFLITHKNNFL